MRGKYNGRILYLEILRIFAALLVIFNHTDFRGFMLLWTSPYKSVDYFMCVVADIICLTAVEFYFMISGAVMLRREADSTKKYFGRILRYLVILIVFSVIYYLNLIVPQGISFNVKNFALMIWDYSFSDHLWFLYAYIAILIMMPFLQSMVKSLENRFFYVLIAAAVIFNILLPCFQAIVLNNSHELSESLVPEIVASVIFYPCLGYFIENRMTDEQIKKWILPSWIAAVAELALMTGVITVLQGRQGEVVIPGLVKKPVFICIAIMLSVKYLMEHTEVSDRWGKAICTVGSCTFGTYLIHMLFLDRAWMYAIPDLLNALGCPGLLSAAVYVIATFIVSGIVTWIVRKIPVIKKLVGG